jgi:hypothetical protein
MGSFLLLEGLMIGVFTSLDVVLFYVFWEAILIPMFLIIGIWGGPRRVYATIKFFLYTFMGSVFMLVALLYLYRQTGSFELSVLHSAKLTLLEQKWIFVAFLMAFAVKVPMWPVHTWLPDAHVEAPTGGSIILAAVMLKLGGYGFLRFSLPIAPDASAALDGLMIALSLIAIVYIGFVALAQQDMKKLISVKEIEDNLRDASIVGLASHVNWVVGFPTETPGDWLHSLVVLYNTRKWIYAISPGMTCGDAAFSDINVNWAKYELQWLEKPWDNTFMSNWWTKDYANTIIHRGIRLKFMNIWLRILQDEAGATLVNGQNRKNITDFYSFSHNGVSLPEGIKQYWNTNMDKFGKGFSNSIANEYLPMAVALHSVFGDYEFKLNTTPELDIAEFGGFIGTHYTASLSLSVVDSVLKFELSHSFDHATSRDDVNVALHEVTREDMSFDTQYYSFELPMSSFSGAPVHSVTHNIIPTVTN